MGTRGLRYWKPRYGRRLVTVLSVLLGLTLASGPLLADLTLHTGPGMVPFDPCQGGLTPGGTWLLNGGEVKLLGLSTSEWAEIENDIIGQFTPGWTYTRDGSLDGDLWVLQYEAFDYEYFDTAGNYRCKHGAEITVNYDKIVAPEGQILDWLQVYTESGGSVTQQGPYKWTADPPAGSVIDGNEQDQAPFYYNQYEMASAHHFWDKPSDPHLEALPWAGSVTFYLFLVSWSGDYASPGQITVYDGIAWGYQGLCVPEPMTQVLMPLSCGLAIIIRRRRTPRA